MSQGPALAATTFHPWVWKPARAHWESGNHGAAVWAAAINVNTQLQHKVDRVDIGEHKLVAEAFGTAAPEPGCARLRLCDHSNPNLFKDRHVGAIGLGQGLFMGVRNPLNHIGPADMSEREALETLAAWSLFARWVDRATVEPGPGKAPDS
ncbi:TIGR02391 family protein [Nocardioides sp. NPDC057772]|uniref:TIGR02391 family protein n=1 Tax=Nocardioides sp. NPDC057772 TaxID=3346245 RepID=UPI00366A70BB